MTDSASPAIAIVLAAGLGTRMRSALPKALHPIAGRPMLRHLLAAVDAWIASLSAEAFEDVVPLLRRTFGAFEPAERRQLGALLATGRIERAAPMGDDVDEPRARAALATVRTLLGLPPATSDAQEVRPADPVRVRRAGSTSDATSVSHADQRRVRNDRADGGGR